MSSEFKSISNLLKERVSKLEYADLYPNIDEKKLKSIFAPCNYWREYTPDNMGYNWFYVQFIPVEKNGKPINLAIQYYNSKFIVYQFTTINDLIEQKSDDSGVEFFSKDIGLDHEVLFKGIETLIITCIMLTNKNSS